VFVKENRKCKYISIGDFLNKTTCGKFSNIPALFQMFPPNRIFTGGFHNKTACGKFSNIIALF